VKVHDNGRPLANISVFFQRTEGHGGAWSLNGLTGSNGVAIAKTIVGAYEAKGLPIGTYRVYMGERVEIPPELYNFERMNPEAEKYVTENRVLPVILTGMQSPIEVNVTKSGAELDVDISKFK